MILRDLTTVTCVAIFCICGVPLVFGNRIFMPGGFLPIPEPQKGSQAQEITTQVSAAINKLLKSALGGPSTLQNIGGRTCGLLYGTIGFNDTCQRLLTRGPCTSDEWLVKKNGKDEGVCVPRPCPSGQLHYKGKCVNVTDGSACNEGQMLYVSFSGLAHCDCESSYFYDPFSGHCYTQHEKGYCNFGEYLDLLEGDTMECIANPCLMEGYAYHDDTGKCFRKMYKGVCKAPYFVVWHQNNETAECIAPSTHSIFDLPTLRSCPPGSVRGFRRECRADLFRVPAQTTYPSSYNRCLGGFAIDPRGICRRTHKLFG